MDNPQVLLGNHGVILRAAQVAEIRPLRHAILRAGLPPQTAHFGGDDEPTTRHFAAEAGGRIVACLSFMQSPLEGRPAWQLRGMAVADGWRGRRLGAALLAYAIECIATVSNAGLLWCNARVPALGFYQRQGWQTISEEFDIPTAGPHRRMMRCVEGTK